MKMDTPQKLSLDQSKFRSEVDKLSKLAASLNPMISKSRSKASQVASLRPYQSQAIDWLRQLQKKNCPAIYADEEGLGKRVVILNFLSQVKRGKPHLIVTSKGSLAYWLYEASRHASNLKLFSCLNAEDANIAKNQQNMFDICLSTFDCLLRFWDRLGFDCHYSYLILDDAVCSSLSSSGLFTEPIFSKICLNLDYDHLIVVSRNRPSLQKEIYLKHYLRLLCSKSIQKIGDALLNIFTEQELIAFVKPFILQRDRSEVVDEFVLPQTKLFRYSLSELQLDRYKSLKRKLNELDFTSDGLNFYETFFRGVAKLRNICSAFPKKNLPPLRTELGSPLLEINRTPIDRFSNLFSPCNLNGFSSFSHLPTGSYYLHEDGYLMSQNDGHFRFLLNLGDIFSQNTFGSVDFKAQESVFTQYSDLYQDSLSCTLPHWIDLNSNRLSRDEEERISLKLLSRSSVRQSSISTAKFRKLITILDSLARANHEKVVIFGQSRLLLENLSSALRLMRKNNFNFASRSLEIGDEVLSRYSIFLMPTRVDKLFLQKVNPSYVVFYENDWNPLIDVTLRNLCSSLPNLKMIFYLIHVGGLIDAAIVSCMDQFSNINSILSREYDGLNSDIFSHANYPALLSPFDQKDENLASQFHNSLAIQKALINSEEISSQDDLKYILINSEASYLVHFLVSGFPQPLKNSDQFKNGRVYQFKMT
jgi:SNF2 family DNA or RNA helicase